MVEIISSSMHWYYVSKVLNVITFKKKKVPSVSENSLKEVAKDVGLLSSSKMFVKGIISMVSFMLDCWRRKICTFHNDESCGFSTVDLWLFPISHKLPFQIKDLISKFFISIRRSDTSHYIHQQSGTFNSISLCH